MSAKVRLYVVGGIPPEEARSSRVAAERKLHPELTIDVNVLALHGITEAGEPVGGGDGSHFVESRFHEGAVGSRGGRLMDRDSFDGASFGGCGEAAGLGGQVARERSTGYSG